MKNKLLIYVHKAQFKMKIREKKIIITLWKLGRLNNFFVNHLVDRQMKERPKSKSLWIIKKKYLDDSNKNFFGTA